MILSHLSSVNIFWCQKSSEFFFVTSWHLCKMSIVQDKLLKAILLQVYNFFLTKNPPSILFFSTVNLLLFSYLQAMIVFDPAGANISNRAHISTLQDRYLILLKHYLESIYSYEFAKEYYVSAMDRLCDLKVLSEEHAKILLQVNPVDVEPLMLEVLNLK